MFAGLLSSIAVMALIALKETVRAAHGGAAP
jgi:hypothetical protein